MRASEIIELLGDVLHRRWVRVIVVLGVGVLLLAGKADNAFIWFVQDKAAAIQEDLVEPMFERLLDLQIVPALDQQPPAFVSLTTPQ